MSTADDATQKSDAYQIRIRGHREVVRRAQGAASGVDLDIERGKINIIIGGSGQGKSVMMKHLMGLLKPDKGQIWVDGEDIVPLDDTSSTACGESSACFPICGTVRFAHRRAERGFPA